MTLRQYLPLFEEVLKLLKSDSTVLFICNRHKNFRKEWKNYDFRELLWTEVLLWEGCTIDCREVLTTVIDNECLLYDTKDENTERIEFFTHLINKIKNA